MKGSDILLIGRFARWVARAAPGTVRLFSVLFALYLVAILLSLVSLLPMLKLLDVGSVSAVAGGPGAQVDSWLSHLGRWAVPLVLGGYLAAATMAAAVRYSIALRTSQLRETCLLYLRRETYRTLLESRWQAQARISDADCNRILTAEAGRVALVIELAVGALLDLALLAVLLVVAMALSWWAAMAALVSALALFIILAPLRRRAARAGELLGAEIVRFHRLTSAALGGRKLTLALRRERESQQDMAEAARRVGVAHDLQLRGEAAASAGIDIGAAAGLVLFAAGLALWTRVSSEHLFLLFYCAVRGASLLVSGHRSWAGFLSNLPAFGRVQTLLDALQAARGEMRPAAATSPPAGAAAVDLVGVSIHYDGQACPAISDLSLKIHPGEMVALVGPSGSGKTTLADVCAGILHPDAGVCAVQAGEQAAGVGYVGQEGGLLPLSIRENLLWSAPGASEEACWAALDQADAAFVRALPDGLDTSVGLTGSRFSGGEQKRLALACALVREPSLLVIDEATSQLDGESEGRIVSVLRSMSTRCTVVLVTHRLATTQACDRIIELDQGRITRTGDFHALAASPGFFRRACEQQGVAIPPMTRGPAGKVRP